MAEIQRLYQDDNIEMTELGHKFRGHLRKLLEPLYEKAVEKEIHTRELTYLIETTAKLIESEVRLGRRNNNHH